MYAIRSYYAVAAVVVDEDRVAPPVVEDLVRVRRVENEREADDARAEQRKGGHAVARVPEFSTTANLG